MKQVLKRIKSLDREQQQLLQWGIENGFPEAIVKAENKKLNDIRTGLSKEKSELENRLARCHEAVLNQPNTEEFIALLRQNIVDLDYEGKRLALQALNIKVWVDGDRVEITGSIPVEKVVAITSRACAPLTPLFLTAHT